MRRLLCSIVAFAILGSILLLNVSCTTGTSEIKEIRVPSGLDREQLWNFLITGDPNVGVPAGRLPINPYYENFPLFPGPASDPDEFLNKRLGLPTHGRWVTVRVDPAAHTYMDTYLASIPGEQGRVPPANLPEGTLIVKINYPNVAEPNVIAAAERPAVLTALYKPGNDLCESGVRYNGMDCLGNGWMWAFYGIDSGPLQRSAFDPFVADNSAAFCISCHNPGFNTDYLRGLERMARVLAHEAEPQADFRQPPTMHDLDLLCQQTPTLSAQFPVDVAVDPMSLPSDQRQRLFDCFAWRTFVALNHPVGESRGAARSGASIHDDPKADRVWESYKATYELFQPNDKDWDPTAGGNPAGEWNSPRPLPTACGPSPKLPVIHMLSKSNSRFFDTDDLVNESGQAFAGSFGTLTDRNKNLVRYQVLFNETEFDFLLPAATTRLLTPNGPNRGQGVSFPDGAMEVKASWKVLCTEEGCHPVDDPASFYSREVLVYEAEHDTCEPMKMGLTGLHVVTKTFWAPQWIWATFEQKNNAPFTEAEKKENIWSFYDPQRHPTPDCSARPFLAPVHTGDPNCPNAELNRWPELGYGQLPNQITSLQAVNGSGLNEIFQQALAGTPWANYHLNATQWPMNGREPGNEGVYGVNRRLCPDQQDLSSDPLRPPNMDPPSSCYTMVPPFLRNSSMESYMQTYVEKDGQAVQVSNRSCMGCHASGTDFSFIFEDAVEQIVSIAQGNAP